jgi:hypothetical protein
MLSVAMPDPYEALQEALAEKYGEGGMGTVYLVRDL